LVIELLPPSSRGTAETNIWVARGTQRRDQPESLSGDSLGGVLATEHVPNRVPNSANLTPPRRTYPNRKAPNQAQKPCKRRPSKPAGGGSPVVGRFDSFAAPWLARAFAGLVSEAEDQRERVIYGSEPAGVQPA
jgi:hypothetical protein